MENLTVIGLRSRSRSKTPFLRSSCDHENCVEGEEHTHTKSGRKTPIKRSTPIKQVSPTKKAETLHEVEEDTPPAHRTRHSSRLSEKLIKTSDYSSEESLDRLKGHGKEIYQNEVNSQYERVSTSSQRYSTLADVTLSPILTHNVTHNRSTRYSSPAYSASSTDSSFAEQALADTSALLDREPSTEHLPYRLYKMAGEYWNKYPKTDYTYSHLSRDRVELAPGQVAVPNMSRRSLSQFRIQGPNTIDEPDIIPTSVWKTSIARKRFTSIDSSDDECTYSRNGFTKTDERWWITRILVTILSTITSSANSAYRKVVGPSHRYPYTERRPAKKGIVSQTASVAAAPFYWVYSIIKTVITTTVTTITETISSSDVIESEKYAGQYQKATTKRRWWPWLLLLILPAFGYGLAYTYENYEHLVLPNFTDFDLDLSEFSAKLPSISLPNITLPDLNFTLPSLNLSLPDITFPKIDIPRAELSQSDKLVAERSLPEKLVKDQFPRVTKEVIENRVVDAAEYLSDVAESCWEEIRRFWHGIIG